MKWFLRAWLLVLACCAGRAQAQDLVLTTRGDSINCAISRIGSGAIFFTRAQQDSSIALDSVQLYKIGFYGVQRPVERQIRTQHDKDQLTREVYSKIKKNYQKLRIGVSGTWSYRPLSLDSVDPSMKPFFTKLLMGYGYSVEAQYFFLRNLGAGAEFSYFHTWASEDNVTGTYANGTTKFGTVTEDIRMTFFHVGAQGRLINKKGTNVFMAGANIGRVGYLEKITFAGDNLSLDAWGIDLGIKLGYDRKLEQNISIGASLGLNLGAMVEGTINENGKTRAMTLDENVSTARVTVAVGIRVYLISMRKQNPRLVDMDR